MPQDPTPAQKRKIDRRLQQALVPYSSGEHLSVQEALKAVQEGARFLIPGPNGLSFFLRACAHPTAAPLLAAMVEQGGDLAGARDAMGQTGLHFAARAGASPLFPILIGLGLLDVPDHSGDTPLAAAIVSRQWAAALALAEHGANLLTKDKTGTHPLSKLQLFCSTANSFELETTGGDALDRLLDMGFAAVERQELTFAQEPVSLLPPEAESRTSSVLAGGVETDVIKRAMPSRRRL